MSFEVFHEQAEMNRILNSAYARQPDYTLTDNFQFLGFYARRRVAQIGANRAERFVDMLEQNGVQMHYPDSPLAEDRPPRADLRLVVDNTDPEA
jgi:hypothetical protein